MSDNLFRGLEQKETDNIPELLRGKPVDEVVKILTEEANNTISAVQKESLEKLSQMEKELAELKRAQQQAPVQSYAGVQPGYQYQALQEWEDPHMAIARAKEEMTGPLRAMAQSIKETNKAVFFNSLANTPIANFAMKHKAEIEALVDSMTLEAQNNPQAYQAALVHVKGAHVDELINEEVNRATTGSVEEVLKKLGLEDRIQDVVAAPEQPKVTGIFQRNIGVPVVANAPKVVNLNKLDRGGNYGLTKDELDVASKMGITPEEYKKWK